MAAKKSTKLKTLKGKKTTKAEAEGVRGGARKATLASGKLIRSFKWIRAKAKRSMKE